MKVIQRIRDSRAGKLVFTFLLLNMLFEIAHPTVSLALTSGPSQPEVQSFEPVGTTDMVDVFTGDFNYNIPLMNIPGPNGGYPINLSYHAGVSMDDEASWVGLGWNINSGALVRNVRGLPDDFDSEINSKGEYASGDFIDRKVDQKQSVTAGAGITLGSGVETSEVTGAEITSPGWQLNLECNNYRGMGYSVAYGFPYEQCHDHFKAGLSLDSDDGLGVNVTYAFSDQTKRGMNEYDATIGFNGKNGLSGSLKREATRSEFVAGMIFKGSTYSVTRQTTTSRSSSLSYSNTAFSPSIGNKINTYNMHFSFFSGKAGAGIFKSKPLSLFFSTEDYDDELKDGKQYPVVGYANAGKHVDGGKEEYYTQDFTRQNDGMITRQTPVLGHSYYTHDAYSFTGQGIGGYFRGRRSDIGRVHDPKMRNSIYGFNGSLEFSTSQIVTTVVETDLNGATNIVTLPPGKKIGFGVNFTYGWNSQGTWDTHNDQQLYYKDPATDGKKENHYYQVHGQPTVLASNEMGHIGGEAMYRPKLKHVGMERGIDNGSTPLSAERQNTERVARNTLVHSFNNSEMAKLPEFNSVKYYQFADLKYEEDGETNALVPSTPPQQFERESRVMNGYGSINIPGHSAGYKVLNEDGSYYVYALPAYNRKEVNSLFTTAETGATGECAPVQLDMNGSEVDYRLPDTDKFIHKTTQSPYAHSYMLTAIFGADYVDVTQNGPTDDDLGYWVKFDYVRYTEDYAWRAPYYGAMLNKGARHTLEDNKASYSYGEKELWYLGRVETKTHVAIYHLSEREDNAEASGEYSNAASPSTVDDTGLKIDKISLYVKKEFAEKGLEAKALQEVHFRYSYALCPGTVNSHATGGGKLTLSTLWFTAQGSGKGELNKYRFDYNSGNPADNAFLQNPSYGFNRINGWGGYKPGGGANCHNKYFPYVDQFNQWPEQGTEAYHNDVAINESAAAKADFKRYQDQFASAWCLKKITLPSGGVIKVDYESDDYAYVQDQEATQMFKMTKVTGEDTGTNLLYDDANANNNFSNADSRRIYFKLEEPIAASLTAAQAGEKVYKKYVEHIIQDEKGDRNLFFKACVRLKNVAFTQDDYEYVSGYLPLEVYDANQSYYGVGSETATIDGVSCYTHGYVTVQQTEKKNGGHFNHHPIALLAWQYMQTNTPKLMHDALTIDNNTLTPGGIGISDFFQMLSQVLNVIPAFMSSVGATRAYCEARGFARMIDLDRSVIRLCSPDKKKFGGGHRVRKISITDSWGTLTSGESDRTYGTEYDYTMKEADGTVISSGVAQYEPSIIGDENALKYPLHFHGKNTFVSNNNLFAEHPFNEDLFPGASVGYRKVSVKSSNTAAKIANNGANTGRTGGVTVYSFYTAKEFPTIAEYTPFNDQGDNDYKGVLNLPLPIPFIGGYYRKYYHASQGFKIELNDMHGKPRSVETFELTPSSTVIGHPITSSTYEYQAKEFIHNGHQVMRLHNKVRVVSKDNPTQLASGERDMGVEYDFFTDQRQTKSHTVTAGLEVNLDWPTTASPSPIPSFWPAFTTNKTLTRTYVTNKVIFKTGILKRTVTRDLQSNSASEIVAYDALSGQPLVTKGTNEFGDEIYGYNIPAYWNYDRMGHAFKNINYTFESVMQVIGSSTSPQQVTMLLTPNEDMLDMLVRGDEVVFTQGDASFKAYYADLTYANGNPRLLFYAPGLTAADFGSGGTFGAFQNHENPGGGANGNPTGRVVRSGRRNHYDAIAGSYATKGNVFDQIVSVTSPVDGVSAWEMDNVLSASATLYRDDWDNALTVNTADGQLASNPFLSGHSGIWRPYKSYTYAGTRTKSADVATGSATQDPDLRTDGLMHDVPLFSWDLGNMEDYSSNWEWASEITRYNTDSYEVENVDRLGVKSAALFGFGQNLSIATGGNADYHEMGVMDFERAEETDFATSRGYTNLSFYSGSAGSLLDYVSETGRIKDLYVDTDGSLAVLLDIETSKFNLYKDYITRVTGQANNCRVGLGLISRKTSTTSANIGHYLNGVFDVTQVSSHAIGTTSYVKLKVASAGLAAGADALKFIKSGEHYYGRSTFLINRSGAVHAATSGVSFAATKAHTGKHGMSLGSNASFLQKKLRLKTGEANKYVVSLWVSRSSSNVYRYTTTGSDLVTLSQVHPSTGAVTAVPSSTLKYTCSKVIEGWQKIDIAFTTDIECAVLRLNFTPGASALFVDDVRISPYTGGMVTSVYDPDNFRLRASLNVDNYATFYYYDEQGNLVLRKQETEDGIVTLNEARGNVRKQQ